jgi:hypothetical protein
LIGASVQYATLSHRWGNNSKITQLRLENKAAFQETLPNLPRTFRDAISAARRLELDYIWIDSLCIIQNDTADWEKELSLMGKVYESSTVTITATSSEDHDGGCFFDRSTYDTFPIRISLAQKYGRSRRQTVQGRVRGFESMRTSQTQFDLNLLAENRWEEDVVNAPVNKRGWVLQEVQNPILDHALLALTTNSSASFHQGSSISPSVNCTGNVIRCWLQNRTQVGSPHTGLRNTSGLHRGSEDCALLYHLECLT